MWGKGVGVNAFNPIEDSRYLPQSANFTTNDAKEENYVVYSVGDLLLHPLQIHGCLSYDHGKHITKYRSRAKLSVAVSTLWRPCSY